MAEDNFFDKANFEHMNINKEEIKKDTTIPKKIKENKTRMNISLTPTEKDQVREIADSINMSVSELFAYWIAQEIKARK